MGLNYSSNFVQRSLVDISETGPEASCSVHPVILEAFQTG